MFKESLLALLGLCFHETLGDFTLPFKRHLSITMWLRALRSSLCHTSHITVTSVSHLFLSILGLAWIKPDPCPKSKMAPER